MGCPISHRVWGVSELLMVPQLSSLPWEEGFESSACREAWQIPHFAFCSEVMGTSSLKSTCFMARVEMG